MNREPLIQNVNIDYIIPNRFQPRLTFDEKSLNELASSIKEHGIIQPLVLRRLGDKYEIIAGERRYKAAQLAGLTEVPAIISNIDDNKSAEIALVENVQRRNLNSLEEAKSYKKILDKEGLTQDELAKKIGVSQSTIANKLRLLNLTSEAQDALMNDKISERHARSLLSVSDPEKQKALLNKVISERLTVRQLDDEIKKESNPASESALNHVPSYDELGDVGTPVEESPVTNESENIFNSSNNRFNFEPAKEDKPETLNLMAEEPVNESKEEKVQEEVQPSPGFNLFNFSNNTPEYPSLEDEVTNMNMEPMDRLEEFNPFNSSSTISKDVPLENLDVPLEEVKKEEEKPVEPPKKKILENNLDSVKEAYNDFVNELKEAGYNVSSEDFDFEDLYQMIIKIEKQAE
ncbi:MAG: ParB/RepB/Spo0J family partition protein [Bacilli bacterium]|nr:ParB/RepB/Spo0J family partition protein [Bacilli bacterium]